MNKYVDTVSHQLDSLSDNYGSIRKTDEITETLDKLIALLKKEEFKQKKIKS